MGIASDVVCKTRIFSQRLCLLTHLSRMTVQDRNMTCPRRPKLVPLVFRSRPMAAFIQELLWAKTKTRVGPETVLDGAPGLVMEIQPTMREQTCWSIRLGWKASLMTSGLEVSGLSVRARTQ